MAQIACKFPSEAKPRMVNFYLGHSLFIGSYTIFLRQWQENKCFPVAQRPGNTCFLAADKKIFFLDSSHESTICWPLRGQENRNFSLLPQKNFIRPLFINKECPKSQFTILGFTSEGNLRAIWAIIYFSGHEP